MNRQHQEGGNSRRRRISTAALFVCLLVPVSSLALDQPPGYLEICHRSDRNINRCIKSSLEKFMDHANSDPEKSSLPSLDPIRVPLVEFHKGSGNVSLDIIFKDFRVYGFKNFNIINVKSNLDDDKFEISMESPYVDMAGWFSAEGRVYSFPIAAQGDFHLNLTEVSAVLILRLAKVETVPGLRYFQVENCVVDLLPGDIAASFGDRIDGSDAIGAAFNAFFNRNAQEIFTLIKPEVSGILAEIFGALADQVLGTHPDDVLLPD